MPGINNRSKEFIIKHRAVWVCLLLVLAVLTVYWQVTNHEFLEFDDNIYVTGNDHVKAGLTVEGIKWSFGAGTKVSNFWIPLTWLSHMLDCTLYRMNPGGHHLTSVFFHAANTLLLFFVFIRMTGALYTSGLVAALFALHPLHVESVAWVAERKDVLSTFFWLLTMWAYVRYVERPVLIRYLLVLLFFVMGLMSKPMLVTLPFVLILLDFWPLGRLQLGQESETGGVNVLRVSLFQIVAEKIPLVALSAMTSIATFIAQQKWGVLSSIHLPLFKVRIPTALVSYVKYIGKMIWPTGLTGFYPQAEMVPFWHTFGALSLLACLSFLFIRPWRRFPYLAVGWLWYIGTLMPVIGLIRVGHFSMADRYTYVPLIGLFLLVAWSLSDIYNRWHRGRSVLTVSMVAVISVFTVCTWFQIRHWKDNYTFFKHMRDVTSNNYIAHGGLGLALASRGETDNAIVHYKEAIRINPKYQRGFNNLGIALRKKGKTDDAIASFEKALQINPAAVKPRVNLGVVLMEQGKHSEAIEHFKKALIIGTDRFAVHNFIAEILIQQKKTDEAALHLQKALRIKPDFPEAHINLAGVLIDQDRMPDAVYHLQEALLIDPFNRDALNMLGISLARQGNAKDAVICFRKILKMTPDAEAHNNIGVVLAGMGKLEEAAGHFKESLRINPDDESAQRNLELVSKAMLKSDGSSKPGLQP